MLGAMSSRQVSEYMAYERIHGPIGDGWLHETISQMHEQLQSINYLLSQAHFTDKQHKKGPIPEPKRHPRPWEIFEDEQDDN